MHLRTVFCFGLIGFVLLTSLQCGEKMKRTEKQCTEICLRTDFIQMNAAKTEVELNVVLHNPTKDTLWFWGMSCWSPQNRLVFDKWRFTALFRKYCEETIPQVMTILPGKNIEIPLTLKINKPTNWLRIGFNLNKVDSYYSREDIRKMDIDTYLIDKGKIIWADSISLK